MKNAKEIFDYYVPQESECIVSDYKKEIIQAINEGIKQGFNAARQPRDEGYKPDFQVTSLPKYPTLESYLNEINK